MKNVDDACYVLLSPFLSLFILGKNFISFFRHALFLGAKEDFNCLSMLFVAAHKSIFK